MMLKRILLLLTFALPLMLLSAIPVNAQCPPNCPVFILNNQIRLTIGTGVGCCGQAGSPCTITGLAPVKNLAADIVWFGEYEYLSCVGPNCGGAWPAPGLVPLFGAGITRTCIACGPTWYQFSITGATVCGVSVMVVKTVSLPAVGTWGWARISYQILPLEPIDLWLYYSIDYCDAPVTGSALDNVWSWEYGAGPAVGQPLSRCVPPIPMPTPPGGGLLMNTKGTGVGVLGSWQFPGGSTFPVTRYCGYWRNGLCDTWPINNNIVEKDDGVAFAVDLGTVTAAGTVCDQIFIGYLWDPPESPGEEEPQLPPGPLTAAFNIGPSLKIKKKILENHEIEMWGQPIYKKTSFDASSSYDPDGNIVSWDWDFGDETVGTGEETTHVYKEAGTYIVTLTVEDNDGNTAHAHAKITIPVAIGGVLVPVEKLALLAPYVALAVAIVVVTVGAVYARKRWLGNSGLQIP